MADLAVFVALVGLVGAAGIALGILAARRLCAWDDRQAAAAEAASPARGSPEARGVDAHEDGGDTVD